ncbi:MAG TPA: glycogen-binding domain-containing protein [Gemmatimonadaceae bacterium]|nr:glycogen-binding domain-containing protein [Gemmatimonadaceae bacterium]
MSDLDRDPVIRRAIDELRRIPPVDPSAVRRIVEAAASARVTPADEPTLIGAPRPRLVGVWSVAGLAAAAAIVGFVARGVLTSRSAGAVRTQQSVATAVSPSVMRTAGRSNADVLPVPRQFVFENKNARRISVVGDFNNWNPASAPMTRSSDGTLWSTIVPILPGRHVYGFMVDDSLFTLDPREPNVRDPDLGVTGSVIIVGRP